MVRPPKHQVATGGCDRHQRQNHHRHPALRTHSVARSQGRTALHREKYGGPHRISSQANHPRPHVAQPSAPRNGGSRLRICVYGGEFARLRAAPHRRSAIRRRHLHQPHPRPPRLPQDSGGLHQGEENVFRRLGSRCFRACQRRRQGGQRDGAKLQGKALHLFAPHACRLQGASD